MVKNRTGSTRMSLLIIIFALIVVLLIFKYNTQSDMVTSNVVKGDVTYTEASTNDAVEVQNKNVIVTDRFTQKIDSDGVMVVVSDDGAYSVKKGTVLVNDRVISVSDEGSSVYYVKSPEKSVSKQGAFPDFP